MPVRPRVRCGSGVCLLSRMTTGRGRPIEPGMPGRGRDVGMWGCGNVVSGLLWCVGCGVGGEVVSGNINV